MKRVVVRCYLTFVVIEGLGRMHRSEEVVWTRMPYACDSTQYQRQNDAEIV